jgi:hypothetical protein
MFKKKFQPMKSFFVSAVIFFVFFSSNAQLKNVEDSKEKLVVDLDKVKYADSGFTTSMLFKSIKIIALETNKSCLIGNISKMEVIDQNILIMDSSSANSLYVFDKDGRFIRKLGGVGQGPGEYVNIIDFTLDRDNKTVYILDSRRIIIYEIATGKYIKTINFDIDEQTKSVFIRHIEHIGGKLYAEAQFLEHSENNYLLFIIDELTGKIGNKFLNVMKYNKGISFTVNDISNPFPPFITRSNGDALFLIPYMDHVFEITKEGVFSFIEFKGKKLVTPKEARNIFEANSIKRLVERKNVDDASKLVGAQKLGKYLYISTFIEKGDSIIIDMCIDMTLQRFLINKNTKEVFNFMGNIVDDLLSAKREATFISTNRGHDENGVYFYHDTFFSSSSLQRIITYAKQGDLSPNIIGLEKLLKFDKEDNPILFFYEFK